MPEGKLDLPESLLSLEPMGGSEGDKVHAGVTDESKDQVASDSSIPLSPQWLYNKPNENKMDMRPPTSGSTGNSNDPNQKDGWRLDDPNQKDWRRIAAENESSRRWREEERETGLLSARRDRRKTDRRVDNVSARDDGRTAPSSDRWHDGSNRNSGHEARRDSKWSSRWGPEDKEKESRSEKRTDAEKEDAHNDSQSSVATNRTAPEREGDSRDKWRPRHRMELHAAGSPSHRAAPGFGLERGRVEGSNLGFTLGRGRSNGIGRSSSGSSVIIANPCKGGSVIGKPDLRTETFRYPRGKLLDIYRRQKVDPSFATMPVEMEESAPVTQVKSIEPLAFVAPEAEEEAAITDIWKGKITSSGVAYNSFRKGRSTEDVTDETMDTFGEAANDDEYQNDGPWNHGTRRNEFSGKKAGHEGAIKPDADSFTMEVLNNDGVPKEEENITDVYNGSQLIGEKWQTENSEYFCSDGAISATSLDVKSKLPDDLGSLFAVPSSGQSQNSSMFTGSNSEINDEESGVPLDDSYFYYIDPNGNTQGPFLGADIMLWFEEGYFGMDLPVRIADAPEGTPFQNLGDVMPHLKVRGGYSRDELEESGAFEGKLEPSLSPASAPEIAASSSVNNLSQPFSKLGSFSAQHVHARPSEPEVSSQLPYTESRSSPDLVGEDEEIIFPGRPGSSGYPAAKSSAAVCDASAKSENFPSPSNNLSDSGLPHQNNNKLHPFGLLWSELQGSHSRHAELSDMPSSLGRAVPFGPSSDPASIPDKWSNVHRQDSLPVASSFQDAVAAHLLSQVEPSPNRFDLAEQLMSQQFQPQLQPRNILPAHGRFNEQLLEHLPGQNLIHHKQMANNPAPDLEHLLALQLQQQRQLQRQQQQQQQLQRQQQKLLEERQQAQAQQVLLEQLLHTQMPDSILAQSRVDAMRTGNVFDPVLLEHQLLQEMQQRAHHPARQFVPSVEQLGQAKFGHQDQQRDLFELLSRAQHGQMQSLEHQLLHQEQLQARQLPMALRPRVNIDEERHMNSVWPGNESDQFLRNLAGNQRAHTSGIAQVDFYQRQQRSAIEDQLNQMDWNHSFQDRLHQGLYDPSSVSFERSLSLPAGASGLNMDVVNAMVHAQCVDMPDLGTRMQSGAQMGAFSSSIHQNPHNSLTPNQFRVPHLDSTEGRWSEGNGQQANDWVQSRMQQLHINPDRQKRESDAKLNTEADTGLWMSDGLNDDKARQLLMDLLHQKSGHQPSGSIDMKDGVSFDKKGSTGLYSLPGSSDHTFSTFPDWEAGPNNTFTAGSYNSSVGEPMSVGLVEEQAISMEINEKLPFRSESGALFGGSSIMMGSNIADKSAVNQEYLEVEGRKTRSRRMNLIKGSITETPDVSAGQMSVAADHGEMSVNSLARNSSVGVTGIFDDKIGPYNSLSEDIPMHQIPALSKGQENFLLRRPPVSRASSSQEVLSELVTDAASWGKSSLTSTDGGIQVNQGADSTAPSKTDMRFRRVSSCGDTDVSEPSFIDMLKSSAKKTTALEVHSQAGASDSLDGATGGRGGKKKGKKGRQIDPALLGFKVTSNRIMMGEIQRLED